MQVRNAHFLSVLLAVSLTGAVAWAWSEGTHQKMTRDALGSMAWLDRFHTLKVTPFPQMLKDVAGSAEPVGPWAFAFPKASVRQEKHQKYLTSTAAMTDPALQQFARHLLLSPKLHFDFALGESSKLVSAREVLARYAGEPDWGIDRGLDASRDQSIMGGTDLKKTSSQGFRHMSFLLGRLGEAPKRAQLFFDLGKRAIEKGHAYWGFRFVAWGLHYLEDMGAPVHTNILPTAKYVRLKGMLFVRNERGGRSFNSKILSDLVKGSTTINANYHFLYEHGIDRLYTRKDGRFARAMSRAVKGNGEKEGNGLLSRLLAPRSVKQIARRRAWSRLGASAIARNAIRFFTGIFRQPADGAPYNTVRSVTDNEVERTVRRGGRRLAGESRKAHRRRMGARDVMVKKTIRQFAANGRSIRQAVSLLGRQVH